MMIRPIKNKNARPQLEWYTEYSSTNGGAIVHKKEYDMALEIYCDKLEKALDKAKEIICKRCGCYDCEIGCSMSCVDKMYACDLERIKR